MDSPTRTVAKAVSWQVVGLICMMAIGWLFTGSIGEAGALAGVATASGFVNYILHERAWGKVRWGRRPVAPTGA